MTAPVPLPKWNDDGRARVTRGRTAPRAIAWYGFTAFWGHLRHLLASAIATDNVDSRQWMIPEAPDVLLARVVEALGGGEGDTLTEALGGEVWIDFVADTGDDVSVSEEVARLLATAYEVDDPDRPAERLVLPRAQILFHGGDVAYPVATVLEVTRRLVEPWNRVFEEVADGQPRVLLGVPGNHDWYDGLDGFARLFQAPCAFEDRRPALHPRPSMHPVLAWAEAFARGDAVSKPSALSLAGYSPVQRASYFRLPLAPGLDLFAVDRQLKRVDERQAAYFAVPGAAARLVVVPDPARAWGEIRPHGAATLESLGITMADAPTLLLAGDVHHYERSDEGRSVHVVAGGGGAFLHGARVASRAAYRVVTEFPGRRASLELLRSLPLHCATGGAGWLLLAVFALGDALALALQFTAGARASSGVALVTSSVVAFGTALLVGWRRHSTARVVPFATILGLVVGALPVALGAFADAFALRVMGTTVLARVIAFVAALAVATFASGLGFGVLLLVIARLGLNHAQPYAALGSPAYRHFVRLRVRTRATTSHVDAWVIGVVDPIARSGAVLVDAFRFDPYEKR